MHLAIELNEHYTHCLLQLQQQLNRPLPEIATQLLEQALEANNQPIENKPLDLEHSIANDNLAAHATNNLRPTVITAFNASLDEFDSLYRELAK